MIRPPHELRSSVLGERVNRHGKEEVGAADDMIDVLILYVYRSTVARYRLTNHTACILGEACPAKGGQGLEFVL